MNLILFLKKLLIDETKKLFDLQDDSFQHLAFKVNVEDEKSFGDLSCNVAMIIAKSVGKSPREIAGKLKELLEKEEKIESITIAGPGFMNITLTKAGWLQVIKELFIQKGVYFSQSPDRDHKKYLIEFVSANPTGPMHLGHGRNGIIGDVLSRILGFLGHSVSKEFYINDAGNQVNLLGLSFKARCLQELGQAEVLPEGGYAGEYLIDMAHDCVIKYGESLKEKDNLFFSEYAKEYLLELLKADLKAYRIEFDAWFSEKSLHDSGVVEKAIQMLIDRSMAYEKEGALWFKSTEFGDDKDRVIRKKTGELTYIAADIAYHKNKFDRGYDVLIDILGQDHHGYVKRLKATMEALGYNSENLHVVLYQLVSIKEGDVAVKMSKRAGNFTKMSDIVETVGPDVARFFYLNRKADAVLDFDLSVALKKTDENPVHYIHYAYVRIKSVLRKAEEAGFGDWIKKLETGLDDEALGSMSDLIGSDEIMLVKKIIWLSDVLRTIESTYQTHLLTYYSWELAHRLHAYYTHNRIVDAEKLELTKVRLFMMMLVKDSLELCLELLGLSKPEKM